MEHLKAAWAELTAPGAQFEMVDTVVLGNPMRVFKGAPPHMRFLWEMARGYGDRDYIVYEDERYTYAQTDALIRSLAKALQDDYGVQPGDRVAIAMRNYPEWVIGYWATVSIGAAVVGMNAWWTPAEMEYAISDSTPKVILADKERLDRLGLVLDALRAKQPLEVIAVRADASSVPGAKAWDDVVDPANAPAEFPSQPIDPDDDVCIFYTSGTTGFPKGAQLTHRGSVSNIMNLIFWATATGLAGRRRPSPPARRPPRRPSRRPGSPCTWRPRRCST
jgi:long-chain acyl-CoA synthetase